MLNNPTALINLSAAGDLCIVSSAAAVTKLAIGTAGQSLVVSSALLPSWAMPPIQSYLVGCQVTAINSTSTGTTVSASSGTLTFSSGIAVNSTDNSVAMVLATLTGLTSAPWTAGTNQPKLDNLTTGSTGNLTLTSTVWYHVYVISSATGAGPDVYYSTSTAPVLPSGYSKSRRIASFYATTSGSTGGVGIRLFTQDGDYFRWNISSADVNVATPSTASQTPTLLVPTGVQVQALFNGALTQPTAASAVYFSDPAITSSEVGSATANTAPFASLFSNVGNNNQVNGQFMVRTNASGQIRYQMGSSAVNLGIQTLGWVDPRGRNA